LHNTSITNNIINYSYTITNLPPKTYYFYAVVSNYKSNTVQTTINTSLVTNPTLK